MTLSPTSTSTFYDADAISVSSFSTPPITDVRLVENRFLRERLMMMTEFATDLLTQQCAREGAQVIDEESSERARLLSFQTHEHALRIQIAAQQVLIQSLQRELLLTPVISAARDASFRRMQNQMERQRMLLMSFARDFSGR
jgi:hypothetical protein